MVSGRDGGGDGLAGISGALGPDESAGVCGVVGGVAAELVADGVGLGGSTGVSGEGFGTSAAPQAAKSTEEIVRLNVVRNARCIVIRRAYRVGHSRSRTIRLCRRNCALCECAGLRVRAKFSCLPVRSRM